MKRIILTAVCILLMSFGCGTKHLYQGAERPEHEVAVLNYGLDGDGAYVFKVDSHRIRNPYLKTIHLLPGRHVLKVHYRQGSLVSMSAVTKEYDFEAREKYILKSFTSPFGGGYGSWQVEIRKVVIPGWKRDGGYENK